MCVNLFPCRFVPRAYSRQIVTTPRSTVCLSVCLSVYVSVCVLCTAMSFAKTDEPIEMPSVCCSGDVWLLYSILFVWHTYMYTVSQTQKHIFVGV